MTDIDSVLRRLRPDIPSYRDRQREAVERVVSRRNTVCLMPTGMGKSLVFEVATDVLATSCVVISPLIALMRQQAGRIEERGAPVLNLGGVSAQPATEKLRRWEFPAPGFLFVSPERFEDDAYLEHRLALHRDRIGLVVVDEVHCVSQWGHGFRPPYKTIPRVLDRVFGRDRWPVVLGLTATVSATDLAEICSDFRVPPDGVLRSTARRDNLALTIETVADEPTKVARLESILDEHRGEKIIVYTHRKRSERYGTRALAERFEGLGHVTAPFDADLGDGEKDAVLERFERGDVHVVFATGAFGMGIDIPDIRGVVHYLLPESVEQYHQEVGRAGRDGLPAFGHLLFTEKNAEVRRKLVAESRAAPEDLRELHDQVIRGQAALVPRTTFQSDDDHARFYAMERGGAVRVVAKGPTSIRCFAPSAKGAPDFVALSKATKRGVVQVIASRLGIPVRSVLDRLNRMYDSGQINLERAPDRGVFIEDLGMDDARAEAIAADINATVDRRLAAVDELVAAIQRGVVA